jgi:hypothetical protein
LLPVVYRVKSAVAQTESLLRSGRFLSNSIGDDYPHVFIT